MILELAYRALRGVDARCLWKLAWNFGVCGTIGLLRFKRRIKRGAHFPPFLYISVTNACNLRCQGCWMDVDSEGKFLDLEAINRMIAQAKEHGNRFFGILGGEPFLHPRLLDILESNPDCYFQIFTNGHFITDQTAATLRRLGNATILVSIEGLELTSKERRGTQDVFNKSLAGLDACIKHRLLTGVATSLCKNNIDELLTEDWLRKLIERGVHYAWYHSYRPVGPRMNSALALRPEQHSRIRRFVVEMRSKLPIGLVDAYFDADGKAICSMAIGICHHIGPMGDIEPCPIIQFATDNISDKRGIYETIRSSAFLADFREAAAKSTRGCVLLERPGLIADLVAKHGAHDSTIRATALAELKSMGRHCSHYIPGGEIPEKHWLYRLAKRFLFDDHGMYKHLREGTKKDDRRAQNIK